MLILAVDDEKLALDGLVRAIREAEPGAEVRAFQNGENALSFARETFCDIVFLDVQLRGMNGIEIARQLKLCAPRCNIIFTTGYSEYRGEAFDLHASGYIMKPVTAEKVKKEICDLRYPAAIPKEQLVVRAFGNFEVYWNAEPVRFRYSKTKELLAYLVDRRGALCGNRQLIEILWEDTDYLSKGSYLSNLRYDLTSVFQSLGCADILIHQPGRLGIRPERIKCDFYDWLDGKAEGINAFYGEYMSQYSWSEFTLGQLDMLRMDDLQ